MTQIPLKSVIHIATNHKIETTHRVITICMQKVAQMEEPSVTKTEASHVIV